MILPAGNFDVVSMSPKVDLGIKWESVGGFYHPVDYGETTTHVSSVVTVAGEPDAIDNLRASLEATNGGFFGFHVYPGETIWGVTFDYNKGLTNANGCSVTDIHPVQSLNGVRNTLTFTIHAIIDMSDAVYDYSPWPGSANMMIESFTSSVNTQTKHIETISGITSSGFLWSQPTVTVNYIMKQVHAAHFMSYVFKKRSGYFNLPATADLFGDGTTNNEVYCVGYPNESMLDRAGAYYRIQATFARKQ